MDKGKTYYDEVFDGVHGQLLQNLCTLVVSYFWPERARPTMTREISSGANILPFVYGRTLHGLDFNKLVKESHSTDFLYTSKTGTITVRTPGVYSVHVNLTWTSASACACANFVYVVRNEQGHTAQKYFGAAAGRGAKVMHGTLPIIFTADAPNLQIRIEFDPDITIIRGTTEPIISGTLWLEYLREKW